MTEIVAAIVGVIGTILVSIFTYFMARRAGIGPYQDTLVSKLKDIVDAQETEVTNLKKERENLLSRVEELERRVEQLEELTINQALIIDSLSPKQQQMIRQKITPKESD